MGRWWCDSLRYSTTAKVKINVLGIATGSWEESAKLKLEAIGIELGGICFSNSDYHKSREAITKYVIGQLTRKNQKKRNKLST